MALLLDIINGQKDIQAGNNGSAISASYTEDQLFEMMKDPRYETDKTWQQKVSDGFKALYPENDGKAAEKRLFLLFICVAGRFVLNGKNRRIKLKE